MSEYIVSVAFLKFVWIFISNICSFAGTCSYFLSSSDILIWSRVEPHHLMCFCSLSCQTLEGISDIRDESDRSGMRVVIEVVKTLRSLPLSPICPSLHIPWLILNIVYVLLNVLKFSTDWLFSFLIIFQLKRGSDPAIVLNNLYRLTALQSSFSCNMVG